MKLQTGTTNNAIYTILRPEGISDELYEQLVKIFDQGAEDGYYGGYNSWIGGTFTKPTPGGSTGLEKQAYELGYDIGHMIGSMED